MLLEILFIFKPISFIAAFIFSELITIGGYFAEIEWGYVLAFVFFIIMMFIRPEGLFARKS